MKGRHASTYAKAKAEAESARKRAKAEASFNAPTGTPTGVKPAAKHNGRKELFALLGEIQVPQKVDKDGYGVPGVWVLPGCREATTAELYAISKEQGMSLLFTNAKGA